MFININILKLNYILFLLSGIQYKMGSSNMDIEKNISIARESSMDYTGYSMHLFTNSLMDEETHELCPPQHNHYME